jgi:serine/threonine protein kinase/Flp pilus assembly protein TadD
MSAISVERWQRASPHLDQLLDLPPTECDAYLMSLRLADHQVADDVEALLAEHRLLTAEGFLASSAAIHRPEPALVGVTMGAYRLISPIGHGGMGSVWLAERSDGRFTGHAALKLLNAALVGRSAEERFKREGTILARLTHPHIGRLIDAGLSATGQPFLVLEHIDGRPIDRYCDEERLGIDQRIGLFLDVQAAVSHAHANLVVHRDLKPSNVLVTTAGKVKLLDFGIAKLLEAGSGGPSITMLTREGDVALTPKYAAPEQVTGGQITTATDVYALGVILFELLSGQHPTGLDAQTPAEFVRAITDRAPLRLSTAVGVARGSEEIGARAAKRGTTPDRLRRMLQGDLDTILGKALKTDAAERYVSVAEFGDDLRRYLDHRPIAARGDAFGYRTAKFVRRHHRVLAAAAVVLAIIASLLVFYTSRLSTERDRARLEAARSAKVSELLIGLLTSTDPYRTPDSTDPGAQSPLDIAAQRVDKELAGEPELQARILTMIGRTYERMELQAKALPLLERALVISRGTFGSEHPTVAQSLNNLGVLYRERGNLAKAEPLLRESLALRRRLLGAEDKDVAVTLVELARVLNDGGRFDEAEPLIRESLAVRRKVFGEEHRETAVSKSELGRQLMRRGDLAGAEPLLRENADTTMRTLGAGHPNTAAARSTLAQLLMINGDAATAEAMIREAVEVNRRVFGAEGIEYAQSLNNLATAVEWQGRLAEAQDLFEHSVRIAQPQLGEAHPRVQAYLVNLARVRIARGDGAATAASLGAVLSARQQLLPPGDWRIAQTQSLLGAALLAQKRYADAEPLMIAAAAGLKALPGLQDRERVANLARLETLRQRTRGNRLP